MLCRYYSIFDNKSELFGTLFTAPSDAGATRIFAMELNRQDPGNALYLYPDDFTLMYITTFDTETGKFMQPQETSFVVNGATVKN